MGLVTNFESDLPSAFYAHLYRHSGLPGGHVVMLGDDQASRCVCLYIAVLYSTYWPLYLLAH